MASQMRIDGKLGVHVVCYVVLSMDFGVYQAVIDTCKSTVFVAACLLGDCRARPVPTVRPSCSPTVPQLNSIKKRVTFLSLLMRQYVSNQRTAYLSRSTYLFLLIVKQKQATLLQYSFRTTATVACISIGLAYYCRSTSVYGL